MQLSILFKWKVVTMISNEEKETIIIDYLHTKYSAKVLIIVGSRAVGDFKPQSDWDILLLCPDEKTIQQSQSVIDNKGVEWSSRYSTRLDIKIKKTKSFLKELRYDLTKLSDDEVTFSKCVYEDYIRSRVQNPLFGESLTKLLGELT